MEREKSKADSRAACRGEPAQDNRIIELYWQRDEEAIRQTEKRYGRYLLTIACNILSNREDGRETVNDTYLKAWNSMPPHRPSHLSSFLAKTTRDLSIDRFRRQNAVRRRATQYALSLSELAECVEDKETPLERLELAALAQAIGEHLRACPAQARDIFICRYYFMDPVREIAGFFGVSESTIKSTLHRTRTSLRAHLEKEGFKL